MEDFHEKETCPKCGNRPNSMNGGWQLVWVCDEDVGGHVTEFVEWSCRRCNYRYRTSPLDSKES